MTKVRTISYFLLTIDYDHWYVVGLHSMIPVFVNIPEMCTSCAVYMIGAGKDQTVLCETDLFYLMPQCPR